MVFHRRSGSFVHSYQRASDICRISWTVRSCSHRAHDKQARCYTSQICDKAWQRNPSTICVCLDAGRRSDQANCLLALLESNTGIKYGIVKATKTLKHIIFMGNTFTSVDTKHVSHVSVLVGFINGNEIASHSGTFHLQIDLKILDV